MGCEQLLEPWSSRTNRDASSAFTSDRVKRSGRLCATDAHRMDGVSSNLTPIDCARHARNNFPPCPLLRSERFALNKGSGTWFRFDRTLEIPKFAFLPSNFNDFDVLLARPLGRLGASRPPAAGEGISDKANPWGNLRNSSLRCQGGAFTNDETVVAPRTAGFRRNRLRHSE